MTSSSRAKRHWARRVRSTIQQNGATARARSSGDDITCAGIIAQLFKVMGCHRDLSLAEAQPPQPCHQQRVVNSRRETREEEWDNA
jgi:hypothetical protein